MDPRFSFRSRAMAVPTLFVGVADPRSGDFADLCDDGLNGDKGALVRFEEAMVFVRRPLIEDCLVNDVTESLLSLPGDCLALPGFELDGEAT